MLELLPLERWHIELLHANGEIEPGLYSEAYIETALCGQGVAVFVDGEIMGCGGVLPLWGQVGEAWTIITEKVKTKPKLLYEIATAFFEEYSGGYVRIQTTVLRDFEAGHRFIKRFGFVFEGDMEKFGPNEETYSRYARIF